MSAALPVLKVAVVGCGAIAWQHLPFLARSERCRLIAVCDRSQALARHVQHRFGAEAAFVDFHDLLASSVPDVVHILTPPDTHVALVRTALLAGCHVICEKPMTGSATETRQLLAEARQRGLLLCESRNYLFNDPILELDRMITEGRLGTVVECDLILSVDFLSGTFGDPGLRGPAVRLKGGAIHDFLPHLAYLYLHFTGYRPIRDVRGYLDNLSGNERCGSDFLDVLIASQDARGRLRVASDVRPDSFRLILRGTRGTIETDLFNPAFRFEGGPNVGKRSFIGQFATGGTYLAAGVRNFRNKVSGQTTYHGLPRMLDAIYRALQEGAPAPFEEAQMLTTAELVDRVLGAGCVA